MRKNQAIISQRTGGRNHLVAAVPIRRYPVAMTVGVVGTGRFGRFWAEELARRYTVLTYNRSEREVPSGCTGVDLQGLGACDAVFLCVAISSVREVLKQLLPVLSPRTVVMDTCSVKVYPTRVMMETLGDDIECIGTHPMFGPDSAGDGVAGLPMVFSPVRCSAETVAFWRGEFVSMGLNVLDLTPDQHDREAAYTQGVTHFVGRVLADMDLHSSEIATVGYRRLLAVMEQTCNDPYTLFVDLQHYNPHTSEMRLKLQESLNRTLDAVETLLDTGS